MFGSHATLVVVMASAIFGLCLGEKLSNISLSNYKDVKFENCENSNASSKVERVKLYPCKNTPCVPRYDKTTYLLLIEFIPAEEVRHMDMNVELGGKHNPWVFPFSEKWLKTQINRDICGLHLANSSCPLKAGAPISINWPLKGEYKPPVFLHTLMHGMVQMRFTFLHSNGKPFLCFKFPLHL